MLYVRCIKPHPITLPFFHSPIPCAGNFFSYRDFQRSRFSSSLSRPSKEVIRPSINNQTSNAVEKRSQTWMAKMHTCLIKNAKIFFLYMWLTSSRKKWAKVEIIIEIALNDSRESLEIQSIWSWKKKNLFWRRKFQKYIKNVVFPPRISKKFPKNGKNL